MSRKLLVKNTNIGGNKAADPHKEIGVLAQEVKKVLPEAVFTDDKGMYSVSCTALVPLLINAIKEQQAEIKKLKQKLYKNAALQHENETLKLQQKDFAKQLKQLQAWVLRQNEAGKATAGK